MKTFPNGRLSVARFLYAITYVFGRRSKPLPYESHKILAVGACIARPRCVSRFPRTTYGRPYIDSLTLHSSFCTLHSFSFLTHIAKQNLRMTGQVFVFGYAFVFGQPNGRMVIGLLHAFVRKHVCCWFFLFLYSFTRIPNIFLRKTVIFSYIFQKSSLLFYYFMLLYGVRQKLSSLININ